MNSVNAVVRQSFVLVRHYGRSWRLALTLLCGGVLLFAAPYDSVRNGQQSAGNLFLALLFLVPGGLILVRICAVASFGAARRGGRSIIARLKNALYGPSRITVAIASPIHQADIDRLSHTISGGRELEFRKRLLDVDRIGLDRVRSDPSFRKIMIPSGMTVAECTRVLEKLSDDLRRMHDERDQLRRRRIILFLAIGAASTMTLAATALISVMGKRESPSGRGYDRTIRRDPAR
jgi:hypothetical protein